MKPKGNSSSGGNVRSKSDFIEDCITDLAITLGVVIPAERSSRYVRDLLNLTENQLAFGFEKAHEVFKQEYRDFPSPGQIREWAHEWRPDAIQDSRHILDRGDKPPDWVPLEPGELERMKAEGRQRAEQIKKAVEVAAEEHSLPKPPPISATEWEARRQRQLDEFRKKNKLGGEV